jgi:argininosuccinate synthase
MRTYPFGDLELQSTASLIEDARRAGIDARAPLGPLRTSSNLWARSVHGGDLDEVWSEPSAGVHAITRNPDDCPDEPAYLELEFDGGVPFRANGIEMPVLELIESLDILGGAHGVGRLDLVEASGAGQRRTIYEAPAAVLLATAHADLERLVVPADLERVKRSIATAYVAVLEDGRWFSPTREAMDAFVRTIQRRVTGSVRLKLFKGSCRVVGRTSPHATLERPASIEPVRLDRPAAEGLIA